MPLVHFNEDLAASVTIQFQDLFAIRLTHCHLKKVKSEIRSIHGRTG